MGGKGEGPVLTPPLCELEDIVKALAKKLARFIFGGYSAYYIYMQSAADALRVVPQRIGKFRVREVDASLISHDRNATIAQQADYAGLESHAYACFDEDRIVGVCFYWFASRYLQRNFWPLAQGEAKLVQIISVPEMRGRGVATALIVHSCADLMQRGFNRTFARIWHSNSPSLRAFERAGWRRIALVVEINPFRRSRPIKLRFTI